ncbi:MAG: Gx transporter family protein [Clostridia bacterium]|nr:Gx transporter family protein [Clostridia bacterium]
MQEKRRRILRALALTALLSALGAALGYLDAVLPVLRFIPLPGIKLGLANAATLLALCLLGWQYAAAVSLVRILLVNLLLFPSATALWFALAGGALSLAVMILLQKCAFHTVTVSVAGAVAHNLAQLAAAALLTSSAGIFSYFTVLLPAGIVTGALLGILTALILPRAKKAFETQFSGNTEGAE